MCFFVETARGKLPLSENEESENLHTDKKKYQSIIVCKLFEDSQFYLKIQFNKIVTSLNPLYFVFFFSDNDQM